jgi:adenosylmethionine-8-amino-7-oxononanoate transaminase
MAMNLSARDRTILWHPYTQMKNADPAIPIIRGEGAYLIDDSGKRYLDAIASWWVNLHGHAHPYIAEKVSAQLSRLEHVMFAGFTHQGAVELAERLLAILPGNQARVFYSDDGSTAVEVALKLAIQYWQLKGEPRRRIIALRGAYHGDTFGAMSVSERSAFTAPFREHLFEVSFIDVPRPDTIERVCADLMREIQKGDVAAFIFEPLLQGVAGFVTYPPQCLDALLEICRPQACGPQGCCPHGVLTIADEVLTGFGRTGRLFACDYLAHAPDIVCLSKGLTGGTLALGVTTTTQEIYEAFLSDDRRQTFFHGHSYTANPVACAAALASLDLLLAPACQEKREAIARRHGAFVECLQGHENLIDVRHLGTILALELKTEVETSYFNAIGPTLRRFFLEQGVLLRPLGNVIYTVPPYCVNDDELARIYHLFEAALKRIEQGRIRLA